MIAQAASYPRIEKMVEGIILTSPALRVRPAHPLVGVSSSQSISRFESLLCWSLLLALGLFYLLLESSNLKTTDAFVMKPDSWLLIYMFNYLQAVAPIFSLVVPRLQFKGANKRGIPVTRDPVALLAKYSDPLVYTGPIRVRTGHEILRITSFLMRNIKTVTVPFFVLHGTADKVTDPLASQDLYNEAASKFKDIKLYEGFLHDLLFEPEREAIGQDIINWMEKRLSLL